MVQGQVQGRCSGSCFVTLCSLVDDRASETHLPILLREKKRKRKLFLDFNLYVFSFNLCIKINRVKYV